MLIVPRVCRRWGQIRPFFLELMRVEAAWSSARMEGAGQTIDREGCPWVSQIPFSFSGFGLTRGEGDEACPVATGLMVNLQAPHIRVRNQPAPESNLALDPHPQNSHSCPSSSFHNSRRSMPLGPPTSVAVPIFKNPNFA